MATKPAERQKERRLTPLWIISLFVSLTEVVLGTAVTQTVGGVQIALTAFVMSFPLLVASAFFAIFSGVAHGSSILQANMAASIRLCSLGRLRRRNLER